MSANSDEEFLPTAAGYGRRGISAWVSVAAATAIIAGAYATYVLGSITTSRELWTILSDAAKAKPLLLPVALVVRMAAEGSLALTGWHAFAEFVAGLALTTVAAVMSTVALMFFSLCRHVAMRAFPTRAQQKPESPLIVFPRERGGGAQVGGWVVASGTMVMTWLVGQMPHAFDWMFGSGTDWQFYSLGFVAGGITAAGLFVAADSAAFWWWKRNTVAASDNETVVAEPNLQGFRDALCAALDTSILVDATIRVPRAQVGAAEEIELGPASEAHAKKLAAAIDEPEMSTWRQAVHRFKAGTCNFMITEPLSQLHYCFLVEAMAIVQDEGRIVLVVAPEASAAGIFAEIGAAYSVHCSDITQNIWADIDRGTDVGWAAFILPSIVVVTDETLEERILRKDASEFAKVIERVGLVILFDLHLMDAGQMRLHLAMLFQRTSSKDVRIVAHSARRRGIMNMLRQGFEPTGRDFRPFSLTRPASAPFRAVVLNNDTDARDALIAKFYPAFDPTARPATSSGRPFVGRPARHEIEPLPIVAHIAMRRDFGLARTMLALVDFGQDDTGRRWQNTGQKLVAADPGSDNLSHDLQDLFEKRTTQPDPDDPGPVILAQDRANVVDVLTHLGLASGGRERLAIIASETYPMRDFIVDDFPSGVFTVEEEPFLLPLAPRPAHGLRELARLLVSKMIAGDPPDPAAQGAMSAGISRGEAVALFSKVGERRLLAAHRLSPTRTGIKSLLEQQYGGKFDILANPARTAARLPRLDSQAPIDDDVVFSCRNMAERINDILGYLPLVKTDATGTAKFVYGLVSRDDFGLSYVNGSTLVTKAHSLKVHHIGEQRIEVEVTDSVGADGTALESAEHSIFCRYYSIALRAPAVIMTPPRLSAARDGVVFSRFKVFAPVRRRTYALIAEETMANRETKLPRRPSLLPRPFQAVQDHPNCLIQAFRIARAAGVQPGPEADRARVAFTMQVTLSDVLVSLFPGLNHRVAVISPQAGEVFARLDAASGSDLAAHIAGRYPRLGATGDNGRANADDFDPVRLCETLNRLYVEAWDDAKSVAMTPEDAGRTIDLFIIEDWPSDLGVCGAVEANLAHVRRVWSRYLVWLAASVQRKGFFYRFGGETLIDEFDFNGARDMVAPFG